MNRQKKTSKKHFQASRKYFSICVYTVATFAICLFIYRLTGNWKHTRHQIGNLLSVFSPFLIAFLIAYFINPMVKHIDNFLFRKTLKDRFRRGHLLLSMILAYIIMIGGIILIFIFIVPQIISSISQLVRISPVLYQNALSTLETLDDRFPSLDLSFISQAAQDFFPDVFDFFRTFMSDTVLPFLYNAGLSIISWFINILLAFVISCYLLFSKNKLIKSLKRVAYAIFPEDMALRLFDTLKDCNQIFSQYIIGKTLDSAIIGVICLVSMTILKLPYALIISLIVGITNMIPYFGPFIGAIPGVLILLILNPKSSLVFAILIFAITVGGAVAGVLGMFLGVPIVAVLTYLFGKLIDYLLVQKRLDPDLRNTKEARSEGVAVDEDFKEEFESLTFEEDTAAEEEKQP